MFILRLYNMSGTFFPFFPLPLLLRSPLRVTQYDYNTCARSSESTAIDGANVILFDGILAFYYPPVRDLMDIKIFVDADADTRLVRRIRRDIVSRGRDIKQVLDQYERTVKPSFENYIAPTKKYAVRSRCFGWQPAVVVNCKWKHHCLYPLPWSMVNGQWPTAKRCIINIEALSICCMYLLPSPACYCISMALENFSWMSVAAGHHHAKGRGEHCCCGDPAAARALPSSQAGCRAPFQVEHHTHTCVVMPKNGAHVKKCCVSKTVPQFDTIAVPTHGSNSCAARVCVLYVYSNASGS